MVSLTKIAIIGGALLFLGLFTQEAAAKGLTGTLQRTGLAGSNIGSGAASIGTGVGTGISGFFKGLLSPLWEIKNIIGGFMTLGAPSITVPQGGDAGQGGGTNLDTGTGGGINSCWPLPCAGGESDIRPITPDLLPDQTSNRQPSGNILFERTITWPSGTSANLPLSQAAIDHYDKLGVDVSSGGGGITNNSGGGGGISGSVGSSFVSTRGGSQAASSAASALSAAAAAL